MRFEDLKQEWTQYVVLGCIIVVAFFGTSFSYRLLSLTIAWCCAITIIVYKKKKKRMLRSLRENGWPEVLRSLQRKERIKKKWLFMI